MSRSDSAAVLGTVLVGRYRLDALIGAGAMAEVFRATDLLEQRAVAVKILRGRVAGHREAVARLRREGEVLSSLRHRSIVHVEAAYELEDGVFLVMELLEGETLGARMRRGPMRPTELAPIVAGIVAGLAAAHAGHVVHRDLKPENIFLVPDHASGREGALRVKLLDFGISKVWYGEKLTQTGQILGTPRYMSPEQLGAEVDVDPRIDVYALGVILYEALAGTPPFLAGSPTDLIVAILHGKVASLRSVRPELTPAIEAVVMRAMARQREARFQSARELADAFLDAAGIDESFRLSPRKGLDTRALGSVRYEEELSGVIHAQLPAADEVTASATKPGTFTELPAFEASAPATLLMAMQFDANGAPLAPAAPRETPSRTSPPTALLGDDVRVAALAAAATAQVPAAPMPATPMSAAPMSAAPSDARVSHPSLHAVVSELAPPADARAIPRTSFSALPDADQAILRDVVLRDSVPSQAMGAPSMAGSMPAPASIAPPSGPAAPMQHPARPAMTQHVVATAAPVASAVASQPPRSATRFWWLGVLAIGLCAGGLTAGAVIALLHWFQPGEAAAPPPPPIVVTDAAVTVPDAAVPLPDAFVELPSGRDPGRAPERAPTARRDDNEEPRPGAVAEAERPDAGRVRRPASEPTTESLDPLALATRALRSGDPTGCVDILDDLIAQGATPSALRRRGDCLLRLGERAEAIRDYQRFCRLSPDHPALGEVREVLEGLGQTCP